MVAVKGKGWVLAPSLVRLIDQFNKAYPTRDTTSDGSIGDQAHASRESDHNPYQGFVHAVDVDEDIVPGIDLDGFVAAIAESRDPRVRYLIYEGRILKAYASNGLPAWSWHRYNGENAHSQHAHVSINRTDTARNDLRAWPLTLEDDMPISDDDARKIAAAVWDRDVSLHDGSGTFDASAILSFAFVDAHATRSLIAALAARPAADVDEDALATALAESVTDTLAEKMLDKLHARLQR